MYGNLTLTSVEQLKREISRGHVEEDSGEDSEVPTDDISFVWQIQEDLSAVSSSSSSSCFFVRLLVLTRAILFPHGYSFPSPSRSARKALYFCRLFVNSFPKDMQAVLLLRAEKQGGEDLAQRYFIALIRQAAM